MHVRSRVLALAVAAVATTPTVAFAQNDSKAVCVAASEHGQRMRLQQNLPRALEDFEMCRAASCPALISQDCRKWWDELIEAVPTIVVTVRDARGADITNARALLDDEVLAAQLDGTALRVPVGRHSLRIEVPGRSPWAEQVVFSEGEKGRQIHVVLGAAPPATPASPSPPPAQQRIRTRTPQYALATAAGLAIVAGATATVVGLSSFQNGCGFFDFPCREVRSLPNGGADVYETDNAGPKWLTVGGVALAAAGVATLTYVIVVGARRESSVRLAPMVGGGGGGASLHGSF